jgi:hypothetical protein
MDMMRCQNCGKEYQPGKVRFCSQCGKPLSSKPNVIDDLKELEHEPRPFEALRFTSGLYIIFGWVIGLLGCVLSSFMYSIVMNIVQQFVSDGTTSTVIQSTTLFITIIADILIGIVALSIIAHGQMLQLISNMRDDLHLTTRIIRRLSLMLSETKQE